MTPIVSVIIPAYNAADYIAAALASATAQTLRAVEVIVVDDASTDDTVSVVEAAMRNDSRIRLLRQASNQGPSAARNRAIEASQAQWLALLDADDIYLPDRLERLVASAEASGANVCADNLLLAPDMGTPHPMIPSVVLDHERSLDLQEFVARNLADKRYPGLNLGFLKPIISRQMLVDHAIRYNEDVRFAEDFALYVDCFRAGAKWWLIPYAGYRYRIRASSLTQVQTVADLAVLRHKQSTLLRFARGDAKLTAAVAAHARSVDRNYFYRSFTDGIKQHRYAAAQQTFFAAPLSGWLIIEQLLCELPRITKKALSGGYWATRK